MDVDQILTPLDSAELDSKEQYIFYHSIVDHALRELVTTIDKHNICTEEETVYLKQYCDLLIYTLEALRIKYMYDTEENMKIDLTDSGFPSYLEYRFLLNDLKLKNEYISKLPSIQEIKSEFLNILLKEKKAIEKEKLYQASSIIYYTGVDSELLFKKFVQGKIIEAENTKYEYLVSWSFYDVIYNRPYICFMYFDYDGNKIENYIPKIYEALQSTADRSMNLDSMAFAIDKKLSKVYPKIIKRIDLGPLHNIFAKDENKITHVILESIAKKELDLSAMVIAFQEESICSQAVHKEGNFLNKQYLQVWGEVEQKKYMFTSHRVIQMLYNKLPDILEDLTQPPVVIQAYQKDVISKKTN